MIRSALNVLRYSLSHPMGRRAPLSTAARVLRWQVASRLAPGAIALDWVDGAKLLASPGMVGATGNVYVGLHEWQDMAFALHFLREGDLFLDVGANVGSYTVLAAAVCKARVHAFEPSPETFRRLRANIGVNDCGDRVIARRAAVGDIAGDLRFTVGRDSMNRAARDGDTDTEVVPCVRLDSVESEAPALIKVDTEGFEDRVIAGGRETFARADAVLLEVDKNTGLLDTMRSLGFSACTYDPLARTITSGADTTGNNVLFLRDAKAAIERVQSAPKHRVFDVEI